MSGDDREPLLRRARARLALDWGDDLKDAARKHEWHRIVRREHELAHDDPLQRFVAAAKDLQSAQVKDNVSRRMRLLGNAKQIIDGIATSPSHDPHRFYAMRWALAIDAERESVKKEMAVPDVFVVGQPLDPNNPDELELFRIRRDLVSIINHDLDDDRRGPLLLTGQRRMGKTSLLKMLPIYLGTTTTIVTFNFQRLSGSDTAFRSEPHRFVVHNVTQALAGLPEFPVPPAAITEAWGTALAWLLAVDAVLVRLDRRVLVAIDEVEALQRGIEEGWARDLTFLDFIRAAGDALHRIRFLLVSAHPLSSPRLGPRWADRLISALPRPLGPLAREDAEQLLRKPVDYFPDDVFDDAAVAAILAQTGTHPFLIQAVGNEIVKRLNADRRLVATARDVERALDAAVSVAEQQLFVDLWESFDPAEAELMRALSQHAAIDPNTPTFRALRAQFFVELRGGVPVLAFPLFGRWIRDYRS
jgi:uncharacterized protein